MESDCFGEVFVKEFAKNTQKLSTMPEDRLRKLVQSKLRTGCKGRLSDRLIDTGSCIFAKVIHNKCKFLDRKCASNAQLECAKAHLKYKNGDQSDKCMSTVALEELLRNKDQFSSMSESDLKSHLQKKMKAKCGDVDGKVDAFACRVAKTVRKGCTRLDAESKKQCIESVRAECVNTSSTPSPKSNRRKPTKRNLSSRATS